MTSFIVARYFMHWCIVLIICSAVIQSYPSSTKIRKPSIRLKSGFYASSILASSSSSLLCWEMTEFTLLLSTRPKDSIEFSPELRTAANLLLSCSAG